MLYARRSRLPFNFTKLGLNPCKIRTIIICSMLCCNSSKGAITRKIKHAIKHTIKHKTSPARLAQLLQPSLAFCFSLQPMTAYRTQYLKHTSYLKRAGCCRSPLCGCMLTTEFQRRNRSSVTLRSLTTSPCRTRYLSTQR